ncbi:MULTISPECIES: hypothetical protein [unclassified Haematobacter]|uniref:hypothetical protein n=1 Tax=unclassified Haematobacter TaxID=2640585 RepID=UPI0025BF9924|nr:MULTISPECIES: hypothetical protein [unclassified Haematobacter]
MKPSFTLELAADGIRLFHRTPLGWRTVGAVGLGDPDLGQKVAALRSTALGMEPGVLTTRLAIPNDQILYTRVMAPGPDAASRRRQIRAALEGMTPYAPEELVFDWTGDGREVQVAIVARETLEEAEAFAADSRFAPVAFVAIPPQGQFNGEPFFGQTHLAPALLGPEERVERETVPMRLLDRRPVPGEPKRPPDAAPTASPGAQRAVQGSEAMAVDAPGSVGVLSDHVEEGRETHPPAPMAAEPPPLDADVAALAAPAATVRPTAPRPDLPPQESVRHVSPPLQGAASTSPATDAKNTLRAPARERTRMRRGLMLALGLLVLILLVLLGSGLFLGDQRTSRAGQFDFVGAAHAGTLAAPTRPLTAQAAEAETLRGLLARHRPAMLGVAYPVGPRLALTEAPRRRTGAQIDATRPKARPGSRPIAATPAAPRNMASNDPAPKLSSHRPMPKPAGIAARGQAAAEAENPPVALAVDRPRSRPRNFAPAIAVALAAAVAEPAAPARAAVAAPPQPQMTPPVVAAARQPVVTRSPLAAATESDDEPEPQVVTPRIPTRASVAKQATITKAMNLRDVNLLGVFGTSSNRRALVRLSNGRLQQVKVGDRFDGGQVVAIGASELHYVKSGRGFVLAMPKT